MALLNYATKYEQALDQEYPFVLYFGELYSTENNGRYRWTGAKTIEIPTISVTGRTDADRDTIGNVGRNYDNNWQTKVLENFRKWDTLIHPMDIDETNYTATIENITRVYNTEAKFPEMDAYCVSKLHSDWTAEGMTPDATVLTVDNVLEVFNTLMLNMSNKRVPATGRILYVTPAVKSLINNAVQIVKFMDVSNRNNILSTNVDGIDLVKITEVPPELMGTVYDFTLGWKPGVGTKQINMFLIHPTAVITPVKYNFAQLDQPSAGSQGKWVYYEESYEDVFILNNKKNGIQFNVTG